MNICIQSVKKNTHLHNGFPFVNTFGHVIYLPQVVYELHNQQRMSTNMLPVFESFSSIRLYNIHACMPCLIKYFHNVRNGYAFLFSLKILHNQLSPVKDACMQISMVVPQKELAMSSFGFNCYNTMTIASLIKKNI